MNPGLTQLQPYPFEKLTELKADCTYQGDLAPINLSIGEPQHATPSFILQAMQQQLPLAANYPATRGCDELRVSISNWLCRRFRLEQNSIQFDKQVLPVNGTREALFAFAQTVIDPTANACVLMPNPFYQIYEGATLLAGAEPMYVNCERASNYQPDFDSIDKKTWQRCRLLYLCSPGNPTGNIIHPDIIKRLFHLADEYDFVIAADECYSEIYFDESRPPKGLLQYASESGRDDFSRCIVFHSLSKRSNVPGIRSGFVAGDAKLIQAFLRYRTYHGCAMAGYTQQASTQAWNDEQHVIENRSLYREKFDRVLERLQPVIDIEKPDASFYLWPELPVDGVTFARQLFQQQHVTVLPGAYLSRTINATNPGDRHVRIALVASINECIEAAERIANQLNHY